MQCNGKLVTFDIIVSSDCLSEDAPRRDIEHSVLKPLSVHVVDQLLEWWCVGLGLQMIEGPANVSGWKKGKRHQLSYVIVQFKIYMTFGVD